MKKQNYILIIWLLMLIISSSCSPMYQVLETSSPNVKLENNIYAFENTDLKINYNFWTDGGIISFFIFNKLDIPIYIDWNKSHLIYNGTSFDYWNELEKTQTFYRSLTQTDSYSLGESISNIVSNGISISNTKISSQKSRIGLASTTKLKAKRIIHIPPKSGIFVSKFSISKSPYYTCEFNLEYISSKNDINSKTFVKNETPLNFRNYITYSFKEDFENSNVIDNEFFISTIQNMNMYVFQGKIEYVKYCKKGGTKSSRAEYSYPYKKPNSFFIKTVK